jgi:hypothetical protein
LPLVLQSRTPCAMRVIVAGGRHFDDYELVKLILDSRKSKITEVVCGCATGADSLGERWAKENGIPVKHFPAKWGSRKDGTYDPRAGKKRNEQMAQYADACVTFPGGNGTADMKKRAAIHSLKRLFIG